MPMLMEDLLRVMDFTGIPGDLTVTLHDALRPLLVVAIMRAVPGETAFTTPFDTLTILLSVVLQVIFLFVALFGKTVATKV